MRCGIKHLSIFLRGEGMVHREGWFAAGTAPRWASDCGPSTGINNDISVGLFDTSRRIKSSVGATAWPAHELRALQWRGSMGAMRLATTSASVPSTADEVVAMPASGTNSPTTGKDFLVGLAQLYPNPDDVPEKVLRGIRQHLFGKPIRPGEQTGRRALARPLQGRVLANWYFMPPSELPGFHNEEREYELSKALNRRHRKREGEDAADASGGKAAGKKK